MSLSGASSPRNPPTLTVQVSFSSAMMTPLQVEQSLAAVKQANELILRQLKNLAHNPSNANAAMMLGDALKSHKKAISELWQPDEISPVSVIAYRARQRQQALDQ